ncbi:MAG: class I SAM-dependent methyltransferase [Actinomycetia bacterium]|nr:class I SAM-dependent methyltransferase [Actinomycetes bacterium]
MKLTGERPMQGETPDSLLALHAAGYREVRDRMGTGRFLDVGCGLGDESVGFTGEGRFVVGVDYDAETAASAVRAHGNAGLLTECADGSMLGLRTGAFQDVCSSHLIEHFTDPEHHVREVSRVLSGDGTAFFLTPNEPADFENPYHVYLFTPDTLSEMLGRHFESVELYGLDGDAEVKEDFATRRAMADKLLRFDPLGLRHKLPRRAFVWLHATGRRVAYRYTNTDQTGGSSGITEDQFALTDDIDDTTLVLFAVCRSPIR